MPYVCYDNAVVEFEGSFYGFSDAHSEYDLKNYNDVLEGKGIERSNSGFKQVEESEADAQAILAMIMTIICGERFCEGLLLEYLENGDIVKWLGWLKAIDETSK